MFTVASDSSFVFEPTVMWRSKEQRCFKSLKYPLRSLIFLIKKAWIDLGIMESI